MRRKEERERQQWVTYSSDIWILATKLGNGGSVPAER